MRYCLALILCILSLASAEERFVQNGPIRIACESFGNKPSPALLLIMGALEPGVAWTDELCHRFANEGFFVIRYDNRDTGWSTEVDYDKNPYDLMDLTRDAIAILDDYGVEKAHILGASMGGMIGILMSAHFPERVSSFTGMITTSDMGSYFYPEMYDVAFHPDPEYLAWARQATEQLVHASSYEEKFNLYLEWWRKLNGKKVPFPEETYRHMIASVMERMKNVRYGGVHQMDAIRISTEQLQNALPFVDVPAQIIHGSEDPILPLPHGILLAESIGAPCIILEGMGHVIQPAFFDALVNAVVSLR